MPCAKEVYQIRNTYVLCPLARVDTTCVIGTGIICWVYFSVVAGCHFGVLDLIQIPCLL